MIYLEKISFLCLKIKQRFHYFGRLLFKNVVCSIKFMSDDIMSDVSLINGFIFLLSIKCFVTVNGQLQKETDKLERNLPITI